MGSLKALFIAGVVATGATAAARAADLPPAPPLEPVAPAVAEFSGWYLRADVGVGVNADPKMSTTPNPLNGNPSFTDAAGNTYVGAFNSYNFFKPSLGASGFVDIGVGYQFNNWFRADITGEYRGGSSFSALDTLNDSGTFTTAAGVASPASHSLRNFYKGTLSSIVLLANGYIDLGTWYGITPYIGAGVGGTQNSLRDTTDTGFFSTVVGGVSGAPSPTGGFFSDGNKTNLAWAVMAGLGYQVTPNVKLEMGYRYLNLGEFKSGTPHCANPDGTFSCAPFIVHGKELASNDFRIGMRWMFGAPPPPVYEAPPEPIVRKY
ncbi:MAG: porin family protein [Methylobacteriaceae bacterium]|nr:porin family protein [Methylobacteriaceae bacterium]